MNAIIRTIVFTVMAITVIFYGGAYILPDISYVERFVQIAAPPEKVFAIAGNLRRVPDWSPWIAIDPATRFRFEGPEQPGVGQVMRWASNNPMVGSGTERVTLFEAGTRRVSRIDYPNFGRATATMTAIPLNGGTQLVWSFETTLPGVFDRWAGLMMDRAIGTEYEKGLATLKKLAESPAGG